jgi:hypothetical protein
MFCLPADDSTRADAKELCKVLIGRPQLAEFLGLLCHQGSVRGGPACLLRQLRADRLPFPGRHLHEGDIHDGRLPVGQQDRYGLWLKRTGPQRFGAVATLVINRAADFAPVLSSIWHGGIDVKCLKGLRQPAITAAFLQPIHDPLESLWLPVAVATTAMGEPGQHYVAPWYIPP